MVTMNSDKVTAKRKPETSVGGGCAGSSNDESAVIPYQPPTVSEESPNHLLYKKMEKIVERMQDETTGVPVRTVKSFMSKIPSVFTGSDLIMWMLKNLDVEDQTEALHLAHLMAAHGYFFPIDDHMLTVKNDSTFYRFQTPYFWPSNCWEPENTDYAVYLCKRTMQNKTRLELADYEAENLARLQKMFSRKWEFIFMQAEAQSKVDKKRDKLERKVLDSQERAFWDVHRPMPGCVNTTEIDIKKACQMNKPIHGIKTMQLGNKISPSTSDDKSKRIENLKRQIDLLKTRLDRRNIKVSKVAEACIAYFEQYLEYDSFFVAPECPNPWISDSLEFWEQEKMAKDISARRVKRWAFSLQELLQDPIGREHFVKFLDKEFSGENLKFWEAVQILKTLPQSCVQDKVKEIWAEFLASDASCPINVDSRSYEMTKKNMENPDRWTFDSTAAHVYHLMKSDSYSRYLRSEMYKEFLNGSKKKIANVPKKPDNNAYTNFPNNYQDSLRRFTLPGLPPRTSSPIPCDDSKITPQNNFEINSEEGYERFKVKLHQQPIKGKVRGLKFPNGDLLSGRVRLNTRSGKIQTRDQCDDGDDYVMVFPRPFDIGDFELAEFFRRAYETVYDKSTGHNCAFIE